MQPSKSHRDIAKKVVQVNSLHQIKVKTVIRTQKDFFKHSSHLYTYREALADASLKNTFIAERNNFGFGHLFNETWYQMILARITPTQCKDVLQLW